MKTKQGTWSKSLLAMLIIGITSTITYGAGSLAPVGAGKPARIMSHHVDVIINNGFARTEVTQKFRNENADIIDAIYSFPVPREASLSEASIRHGETVMNGEVVTKEAADKIYGEEKKAGNKAGKAEKNSYQDYKFYVANVSPNEEVDVRFVYYQPLNIDTGVGRYHYPLEEGGTDEAAKNFWTGDNTVSGDFSLDMTVKSAYPLAAVRSPNQAPTTNEERLSDGFFKARYELTSGKLDRDFVFYYRLQDNLPGRIELIANRPDPSKPGTFMMVVTPGLDLKPLKAGSDYLFILDRSGSMNGGKIKTLVNGIAKTLGNLRPEDRFKVVTFESSATDFTGGWIAATSDNVNYWIDKVKGIRTAGGTNLYAGLTEGFSDLDADRAISVVLVTDGVTNQGIVDPQKFYNLLKDRDVRLFGFLMGNSANWPLMRTICDASGGYYTGVSNDDDIVGEIIKAKSKVTHECLRDAKFEIDGVDVIEEVGDVAPKRVYRGEQLIIFGRYAKGGPAKVALTARLTGENKRYATEFDFPETANDNPEIDRLYAVARVENIEDMANAGVIPAKEANDTIKDIGLRYQIVTDETSMLMLDDETFKRYGIERKNQQRVALEDQAQTKRANQQTVNYRVDKQRPAFKLNVPSLGGGGAFDPISGILTLIGISAMGILTKKRIRSQEKGK